MSGDIVLTERPCDPSSLAESNRELVEMYEGPRQPRLTEEQRAMRDGTHPDAPRATEPTDTDATDPAWQAIVKMHGRPAFEEPNTRDGWVPQRDYSNVEWGVGSGQRLLDHAPTPYAGDFETQPCFVLVLPEPRDEPAMTRADVDRHFTQFFIGFITVWILIGVLVLASAQLHS